MEVARAHTALTHIQLEPLIMLVILTQLELILTHNRFIVCTLIDVV